MYSLNDTLDVFWQITDADPALALLLNGGTKHKFEDADLLTQFNFSPASCPVFLMMPAEGGQQWLTARGNMRRSGDLIQRAAIHVEGATKGRARSRVVALAEAFYAALAADMQSSNSILAEVGVSDISFDGPVYVGRPVLDKEGSTIGQDAWVFSLDCGIEYRVG